MAEGLLCAPAAASPAAADTRIATLVRVGLTPIVVGTALGIGYGNIGGALGEAAFLTRYHHPSDALLQALAAAMQAGCVIGSVFAGWLADTQGRRRTILLALVLVVASSAVLLVPALAPHTDNIAPLFVGRALLGLGGGLACTAVPIHVSETAPASYRGAVEASFQFGVVLGILIAYALNIAAHGTEVGWSLSLAAPLVPATLYLLWAARELVESPRWLALRGEVARAENELHRVRTAYDDIAAELAAIVGERQSAAGWRALCAKGRRGTVAVAVTVLALQVATGIDVITVYAPSIFRRIGGGGDGDGADELLYTLLVGVVFVVFVPVAVCIVDRFGRRFLLIAGGIGMTASLIVLAAAFGAGAAADAPPAWSAPASVASVLCYVAAFSISWGPVAWVVPSELVPSSLRAKVVAVGTVANWVADYLVVGTFLSLTNAAGDAGAFVVYAAINAAALAFVVLCVPETKGMELEESAASASAEEEDARLHVQRLE